MPVKEEWRSIPVYGYEKIFSVSNWGLVRNEKTGKVWLGAPKGGYRGIAQDPDRRHPAPRYRQIALVALDKSRPTYRVNRLVWEVFNRKIEPGKVICHYDDNLNHNCVDNLYEGTQKQNASDRKKNKDAIHPPCAYCGDAYKAYVT